MDLQLTQRTVPMKLPQKIIEAFTKPLMFCMGEKSDFRGFFLTFVIFDFKAKEIKFYFSYTLKNQRILMKQPGNELYRLRRTPHSAIFLDGTDEFLCFMEEERFFLYINSKKQLMRTYTVNELFPHPQNSYGAIVSTLFRDPQNPDYFYLGVVDSNRLLHIMYTAVDLSETREVTTTPSNETPPHVLKKFKNLLFLSHDFKNLKFYSKHLDKVLTQEEVSLKIIKKADRLMLENIEKGLDATLSSAQAYQIYNETIQKLKLEHLPGEIMVINEDTCEKTIYHTSGGSPAHFEIDEATDIVYTSSHNFLVNDMMFLFLAPAVIDKFKICEDGTLKLLDSFSHPEGYRFSTHKIFYRQGRACICTFGQPNRLMFIDAETMELLFYDDIGENHLTGKDDLDAYINTHGFQAVNIALEVSDDREIITFVDSRRICFYSYIERRLLAEIDMQTFDFSDINFDMTQFFIRAAHFIRMEASGREEDTE